MVQAVSTRQRGSFAIRFDQIITADEKATLVEGAEWLRDHDGKVEDWEIEANPIAMETLAILYLRAEVQRGNDFDFVRSVGESASRYGIISRGQARGLLNCMRAAVQRKAQAAPQQVKNLPATVAAPVELPRGIFTVTREDGSHRTYRITVPQWGDFTDGRMQISLLTGPQNDSDYQGIAFLMADGAVRAWKSYRGSAVELANDMDVLLNPEQATEAGKRYAQESGNCYRCNRTLTTPESIALGIGPVCASRL